MRVHPLDELKARLKTATQRQVARDLGISSAYLSDVLANKRGVGDKILKGLGLRIRYERVK